jgi:nonribosomal peptide synthetase DhbF
MDQEVGLLALLDSYPVAREAAARGHADREHEAVFAGVADASIHTLLETLRREGDSLLALNEHHYQAIHDVYSNNVRLMTGFLPQRFRGDLLLFVATQGDAKPPHNVWNRYVTGRVKVHRIDCAHETMMEPLPAAKIGSALATELDRRTKGKTRRKR